MVVQAGSAKSYYFSPGLPRVWVAAPQKLPESFGARPYQRCHVTRPYTEYDLSVRRPACSVGVSLAWLPGDAAFEASCLLGGKFQLVELLPASPRAVCTERAFLIVLWHIFWPPILLKQISLSLGSPSCVYLFIQQTY